MPMPLPPIGEVATPSPRSGTSGTTVATGKTYIVGERETMASIAKKTLGKAELWPRIKELNPSIDENAPIPTGTKLVLPADSVIPPTSLPTIQP